MSEAQFGLVVTTPIIIGFAIVLYRSGVLQLGGTLAAVLSSLAIALMLFFTQ